jgi:hypothetical protein
MADRSIDEALTMLGCTISIALSAALLLVSPLMPIAGAYASSAVGGCRDCDAAPVVSNTGSGFDVSRLVKGSTISFERGRPARADRGSSCPGCVYESVASADGGVRVGGISAARLCGERPPGSAAVEPRMLYVTRPGQEREFLGPRCLTSGGSEGGGVDIVQVEAEVRRYFEQMVPAGTQLAVAPPSGGIVNLPAIFSASPQASLRQDFTPLGIPVTVTAQPSWQWTFDPGVSTTTSTPGKPYQDNGVLVRDDPGYVTHTYRTPGARDVSVQVRWSGSYQLGGQGEAVPVGVVTRTDTVPGFVVREAPARLVAGH